MVFIAGGDCGFADAGFVLEPADRIDHVEVSATSPGAYDARGGGDGQMRCAGALGRQGLITAPKWPVGRSWNGLARPGSSGTLSTRHAPSERLIEAFDGSLRDELRGEEILDSLGSSGPAVWRYDDSQGRSRLRFTHQVKGRCDLCYLAAPSPQLSTTRPLAGNR